MAITSAKQIDIPRDYNAASDFVDNNIAAGRATKDAFLSAHGSLTYGDLHDRSNRFANALTGLGIQREQRIALIMLDTFAMPVAFWGAIKAGIVPVPMNTLLTSQQFSYLLRDSRASALVVSAALFETVQPLLAELPNLRAIIIADGDGDTTHHAFDALVASAQPITQNADTCRDETAFWLYSSGSTGDPKGVQHMHSSLIQTAKLYGQSVLGIKENDIVFSAAKLFFAYGLGNAMSFPMSVGATTVLLPDRPTPDSVIATMRAHNPTLFFGVPTLFTSMLASPEVGAGAGSNALRLCVSAGEALPKEIGEKWREVVGVDILDGIGSTEMLHIFLSNRPDNLIYGSSGQPVPGYDARLESDDGGPVSDGEIGELVVRGPSSGTSYWNQREKSRNTFVGPWTYTGDKYRHEANGYYYYCGRTDDMFKVSGIWVSPFDVESALISHNAVLEAAVVGREDDDGLVKPHAFVILQEGQSANEALFTELKDHVKSVTGPWTYPRWIDVRQEFPKTATGKIQRFKLRQ